LRAYSSQLLAVNLSLRPCLTCALQCARFNLWAVILFS
jgi:hypothetical protein